MIELPDRESVLEDMSSRLARAKRPFVLTGAGLGVASGLDTFRGTNGLWNNLRPEDLSSIKGFRRDPGLVWSWYNSRISRYAEVDPNPGHIALAKLQELLPKTTLATQNVDGLQARAGAHDVLEIHGSIFDLKCTGPCSNSRKVIGRLDGPFMGNPDEKEPYRHEECGGLFRPGVVFFGDDLPEKALGDAQRESMHADVIIIAGTSARVQPAARLARSHDSSVMLIEINPDPVLLGRTGYILAEGAETGLPDLIERVRIKKIGLQKSTGR